jgi:hypothetical protein
VVIGHSGCDLFLVPISSQLQNTDYELHEWRAAGLNVRCGIKTQLATVDRGPIIKVIGTLAAVDQTELDRRLRTWLNL